jgi:hypothetical protein
MDGMCKVPVEDIQARGFWLSVKSVARYRKPGAYLRELAKLGEPNIQEAVLAEKRLVTTLVKVLAGTSLKTDLKQCTLLHAKTLCKTNLKQCTLLPSTRKTATSLKRCSPLPHWKAKQGSRVIGTAYSDVKAKQRSRGNVQSTRTVSRKRTKV